MEKKILREGKEVGTMIQVDGRWIVKEESNLNKEFSEIEDKLLINPELELQMNNEKIDSAIKERVSEILKQTRSTKSDSYKLVGDAFDTIFFTIYEKYPVTFPESSLKIMSGVVSFISIGIYQESGKYYLGFNYMIKNLDFKL